MGKVIDFALEVKKALPKVREAFAGDPYYYTNYKKHVTIYKNGHGIVIFSFTIKINDPSKCTRIDRHMNLIDSASDMRFPSLEDMQKCDLDDRMNKYGFWYRAENDFLTKAVEYYWDDKDHTQENRQIKADPKQLRWYFSVDKSKIEKGKEYKFNYVLSVPDMFPVTDGYFDPVKAPWEGYCFESGNQLDKRVIKCKYILSFASDIKMDGSPECTYYEGKGKSSKLLKFEQENELLYNKYIVNYKNLKHNNSLQYTWVLTSKEIT